MTGRDALKRCFRQPDLVAGRHGSRSRATLHPTYEIANFRLGGKYDLPDPSKWENGGEGG